jgi:hypothetical protein
MIAIQLPINFHNSRTVPVSDLCKNAGKTNIDKIYVWNTDTNRSVEIICTIQRGVLEPWITSEMAVGCTKTKIHADYPLCTNESWAACTLKLKQPKDEIDAPHAMIIEIWCN